MLWKEVGNVQKIYVCHDDITGIFSAVYDAWKERRETGDAGIAFKGSVEQKLFCEYTECEEREEKVIAVEKMIKNHLGMDAYWKLYHAALSSVLSLLAFTIRDADRYPIPGTRSSMW